MKRQRETCPRASYTATEQREEPVPDESARLFGLSRTKGAHYVRVLALPSKMIDLLAQGRLFFGQARDLSRLSTWPTTVLLLATRVAALPGTPTCAIRRYCSVREIERHVSEAILQLEQDSWNGKSDVGKKANAKDALRFD